jgi:histidinol-phosphate phosphatase family protein
MSRLVNGRDPHSPSRPSRVSAVLFDRDGTLVVDVPYNGDPARVTLMDGARDAVARLRAAGISVAVVTNQSGVARGLLTTAQIVAVHRRIEELVGRLDGCFVCVHGPDDGCTCRKPKPGLVLAACASLGVQPRDTVVIGDIGADVEAAIAAGARAILVPNEVTRPEEIDEAEMCAAVAPSLRAAVQMIIGDDDSIYGEDFA